MAEQIKMCPCGSGRQQAYCCGEKARGWSRVMNLALPWVLVLALGGGVASLVLLQQSEAEPSTAATGEAGTPEPWQYDRVNNRHWDPTCGHWHPGPPPNEQVDAMPGEVADATMPDGSVPGPWEYDQVNDRHWHPEHGHWHDGPPPENPGSSSAGTTTPANPLSAPNTPGSSTNGSTPEPWEYDEENDQHWHPDHGHWHPGPPPENRQ